MKRLVVFLLLGLSLGAATAQTRRVTVAAAANLSATAEALKAAFSAKNPGISVDFVFGASGALATQIDHGAPFQVFLSADTDFPARLAAAGRTAGPWRIYATGKLILLSVVPRDFSRGLALLTDPRVERFAVANAETAPYGAAALQALKAAGLWGTVEKKAVIAQSVAQAVQFTLSATGIGFVNKSALYTPELSPYLDKEGTNWIEVDPKVYKPLDQAFVVLAGAASDPGAAAFAAFLLSPEGKAVFRAAGYTVPE